MFIVDKPQHKKDYYFRERYPEIVEQHYEWLTEDMGSADTEYLDQLIDAVYKTAYLDGFQDALFFTDY